jgi:ABC-type transport system involved in multi-copper enzyme maturation permease subunit
LLAILPRPIRRADVVTGKWLGLAILLVLYAALAAGLELGTMRAIGGYAPPHPVAAVAFLAGQGLVVLTLGLLASTRLAPVTGGIIALVLFGLAWLAGIVQGIALAFGNQTLITATTIIGLIMPSDTFWRDALYNLEPAALIALAHGTHNGASLAVAAPPPIALLMWTGGWMIVMLILAIWSFGRRDV